MNSEGYLSKEQLKALERIWSRINLKNKFGIGFLIKDKKSRQIYFNDMSFNKKQLGLNESETDDLVIKNILAYLSKKDDRLTLTLKAMIMLKYGCFEPETSVNEFLDDLNRLYFDKVIEISKEELKSRHKAILLGLIGLGAFSNDYCIAVKSENQDFIKKAIDQASEFIKSLGQEYQDDSKLWEGKGVESPVRIELRSKTNEMPVMTENVYVKGDGGHYIDILSAGAVDKNKLKYLLQKIFNKTPLNYEEKKRLIITLDQIYRELHFKVFKGKPTYDSLSVRHQIKRIIESDI